MLPNRAKRSDNRLLPTFLCERSLLRHSAKIVTNVCFSFLTTVVREHILKPPITTVYLIAERYY